MAMFHLHQLPENERISAFCRAVGAKSCLSAVRIHAKRVLIEYGKTTPAFDAWDLCELHGIEVQITDLSGCDARLLPVRGGYIAEIHSGHSRERQSFSLCHELGHTLFDRASGKSMECDLSLSGCESKLEERLCEQIASELLMPRRIFTNEAVIRKPGWDALCEIADIFRVSKEAAINRIQDLDIWKCLVMMLRSITTYPEQEKFELEWAQPSASLRQNVLGIHLLTQTIIGGIHSGAVQVTRITKEPCEVDLGLSTPLLLSGHSFAVGGTRFLRLMVVKPQLNPGLDITSCPARGEQASLFIG